MVIDASVLVSVLGGDGAQDTANRSALSGQDLFAPDFVDLEVVNTWRRLVAAGRLSVERANIAVHDLGNSPLVRVSSEAYIELIWSLRDNVTAYDASYVALATAIDRPLVTLDRRLAQTPNLPCKTILLPGPTPH